MIASVGPNHASFFASTTHHLKMASAPCLYSQAGTSSCSSDDIAECSFFAGGNLSDESTIPMLADKQPACQQCCVASVSPHTVISERLQMMIDVDEIIAAHDSDLECGAH